MTVISYLLIIGITLWVPVQCQVDGSFWWNNKDLLQKATESRNNKNLEFKNEEIATTNARLDGDDGVDCTCVHSCKCQVVFKSPTTSHLQTGSLCGSDTDQVCCHIIKLPIPRICFEIEANATSRVVTTPAPPSTIRTSTIARKSPTTRTPLTTTTPPIAVASHYRQLKDAIVYPDDERLLQYSFLLGVYIRDPRKFDSTRICGAALLSRTSAVTAQHCVRGSRFAPDFMIKTADDQMRIITEITRHPEYYSGGLYNDLAILQWDDPIRFSDNVDSVNLPSEFYSGEDYTSCSIITPPQPEQRGVFRSLSTTGPTQEPAQLIDHESCERLMQKSKWGPRFRLHENFTCAESNRRPSCSPQDSNGIPRDGLPLICYEGPNRNPVLLGIISWYSCNKQHPDVLMSIPANLDWISDYTENTY